MAYHEVAETRRYQFRTDDNSYWVDSSEELLPELQRKLREYIRVGGIKNAYEIRMACAVSDDAGVYVGELGFAELVERYEPNTLDVADLPK